MKTLDRYLVREIVPPFLLALALIVLALLMNQFLLLADVFIARGVPAGKALELLGLLIPSAAAFALPVAFLAAVVAAFSRLAVDSEITALRALGVPSRRLICPVLVLAAASFLLTFWLAAFAAPGANAAWTRVMSEAVLVRAGTDIGPLEFGRSVPGATIFYRSRGEDGSWREVFAFLERGSSGPRVLLAGEARSSVDRESGRMRVSFFGGRAFDGLMTGRGEYSVTDFERLDETIDISSALPSGAPAKSVRDKDLIELLRDRAGSPAGLRASGRAERLVEVEIHKKFSLPFLCLVFALFGPQLGLLTGRRGRPVGFALGLLVVFLVYSLYMTAERLAAAGRVVPALSMWLPPLVLAALGAGLVLAAGDAAPGTFRSGRLRRPRRSLPSGPAGEAKAGRRGRAAEGGSGGGPKKAWSFPFAILDRYVFKRAFVALCLAAPAYLLIACLATAFENMDEFMRHGRSVSLLVEYVLLKTPELLALTLPLAMLTAAIVSMGLLARSGELTAMKASGMSVQRVMGVVVILGLLVSGGAFLIRDRLSPPAEEKARALMAGVTGTDAGGVDPSGRGWSFDGRSRKIYRYEYYEPRTRRFGSFSAFELDAEKWALSSFVRADEALLGDDGRFLLKKGTRTVFGAVAVGGSPAVEEEVLDYRGAGTGAGAGFFGPAAVPGRMNFGRLRAYASLARRLGFDTGRLEVELAGRVALPLACLVMAMIGLPAGLLVGRRGFAVAVGSAVVLAAVYWGIFALLRGLGNAGNIPPAAAAWGANVVFGLAAIVLISGSKT